MGGDVRGFIHLTERPWASIRKDERAPPACHFWGHRKDWRLSDARLKDM